MHAAVTPLRTDARIIGLVCVAHLLSHFYALAVAPIFFLLREEFGVTYAAMGFATTLFYVASGTLQTPAGFLVDRLGGKRVLTGGLVLIALGTLLIGLAPNYPLLCAAFMVAGAGNAVFHPADMAILNARISPTRLGYAFSLHGVSGNLGWVVAPMYSVAVGTAYGWRTALVAAGVVGLAMAVILGLTPALNTERHGTAPGRTAGASGWQHNLRVLFSAPVLACFLFFFFSAIAVVGLQTFAIPAMTALYGVAVVVATGTLTGYLVGGVVGTLTGGVVAAHTKRHDLAAVSGILLATLCVLVVSSGSLPTGLLFVVMAGAGFFIGSINPSRDFVVRDMTPAQERGKVYGFVYSGLDLGAAIAPPVVGWLIDSGQPRIVFFVSAVSLVLCAATMFLLGRTGDDS